MVEHPEARAASGLMKRRSTVDRAEKENWVASLHRTFSETAVVLVAHYSGLTVAEIGDLRKRMRDTGAGLRVTKNRLTRLALADTQYRSLEGLFKGPTAIAFANDPVGAAKVAVGYAKSNPKLVLLGGSVGGHLLDAEGVRTLATLPSLDELRGQLIGLLNAPATRIAGILQAPAGQLARVLSAYGEKSDAA
jgi:large subunit ribosomal protein L10